MSIVVFFFISTHVSVFGVSCVRGGVREHGLVTKAGQGGFTPVGTCHALQMHVEALWARHFENVEFTAGVTVHINQNYVVFVLTMGNDRNYGIWPKSDEF